MNRYGSGRARANERFDDMKLLELYLARVLMGQILVVLGVLAGIFAFVTFIDQVSHLGTGNYSVLDALRYVLLSTPRITYDRFTRCCINKTYDFSSREPCFQNLSC